MSRNRPASAEAAACMNSVPPPPGASTANFRVAAGPTTRPPNGWSDPHSRSRRVIESTCRRHPTRAGPPPMHEDSVMADCDIMVVGAGLAGLVAAVEAADAGQVGDRARPGGRGEPRRPGLVVARRPVPGRHPGAAAPRHQGFRASSRWPTGWVRPGFDRAGGPLAAAMGGGVRRLSRPARAGAGSRNTASRSSRSCSGPSAAVTRSARPRQFGAALPRDLGLRTRRR